MCAWYINMQLLSIVKLRVILRLTIFRCSDFYGFWRIRDKLAKDKFKPSHFIVTSVPILGMPMLVFSMSLKASITPRPSKCPNFIVKLLFISLFKIYLALGSLFFFCWRRMCVWRRFRIWNEHTHGGGVVAPRATQNDADFLSLIGRAFFMPSFGD